MHISKRIGHRKGHLNSKYFRYSVLLLIAVGCPIGVKAAASSPSSGACPTGAKYLNPANPTGPHVTLSSLGITRCYYISASGSDSNSGATESSPWLHAPGMSACSGTCKSTTPAAGQGFIFRGGETWHVAAAPVSGALKWTWSGSSSAPIYVGIDPTWYAGSSFERPIINLDNLLSTSTVTSCTYDDDSIHGINLSGQSYITVDGVEMLGACSTGRGYGGYIYAGVKTQVERVYLHGWTLTTTAEDDILTGIDGRGGQGNRYFFNVIDGSDSTYGAVCNSPSCVRSTANAATGWAMKDANDVEYSVIRHVSNGIQAANISTLIGNLFEYQFTPSFGGRHGNVVETIGGTQGTTCYFYNNITRDWSEGVSWWPQCSTFYIINNVWENSGHIYGNPPIDPNGLFISPPGVTGIGVVTAYVYNSTFQSVSSAAGPHNSSTAGWASGSTAYFANNHIMDFTSITARSGFFRCNAGDTCSTTDNGGQVYQTTAAANAHGYTLRNNYAPTSSKGATVGAGKNLTRLCPSFSSDSALCSGTSGAVIETDGWGGKIAKYPGILLIGRPTIGAWDAGAYEYPE